MGRSMHLAHKSHCIHRACKAKTDLGAAGIWHYPGLCLGRRRRVAAHVVRVPLLMAVTAGVTALAVLAVHR